MAGTKTSQPQLLDELASLDPRERHDMATTLHGVSATFAEVPDGMAAAYMLGLLAHVLDPAEL